MQGGMLYVVRDRSKDCSHRHQADQERRHNSRYAVDQKDTQPIVETAACNQLATDAEEPRDSPATQVLALESGARTSANDEETVRKKHHECEYQPNEIQAVVPWIKWCAEPHDRNILGMLSRFRQGYPAGFTIEHLAILSQAPVDTTTGAHDQPVCCRMSSES